MIPYGQHSITEKDVQRVADVVANDRLTQGEQVEAFEEELTDYFDADHAIVVNNGTTALYLAYKGLDLSEDDIFYTVPNTFVATSNAALMLEADVRFVDINYETGTMDLDRLSQRLAQDDHGDSRIFIVPVHFAGLPCDMPEINSIAQEYDATVVEDACHAPGGRYKSEDSWHKVGSCEHSDAATFSFHPVKHFTTGEGGAVLTNVDQLAESIKQLRHHGIDKDVEPYEEGPWYYEMNDLGMNGRITDFQCALGRSQLSRLDEIVERRREIADEYDRQFKDLTGVESIRSPDDKRHAYHLYVLRSKNRDGLFDYLNKRNIAPQVHYIPVTQQPYYRENVLDASRNFENSQKHYQESLSIPMYPDLSEDDHQKTIESIRSFCNRN